jgi:hypothetical protein
MNMFFAASLSFSHLERLPSQVCCLQQFEMKARKHIVEVFKHPSRDAICCK